MPIAAHSFPRRASGAGQLNKIDVHLITSGASLAARAVHGAHAVPAVRAACTHRRGGWCGARARPHAGRARGAARPPGPAPPAPAAAALAAWRRTVLTGDRSRPRAHYFGRARSVVRRCSERRFAIVARDSEASS